MTALRFPAILAALWLTCIAGHAQQDNMYKWDAGISAGLTTYWGDLNGSLFRNAQPLAGATLRRVLNPHTALRFSAMVTRLKGSTQGNADILPQYTPTSPYRFRRGMADVNAVYEYNFWSYGTGKDYRGARPLTPYLPIGIGMVYTWGNQAKAVVAPTLMLGLGAKYKVSPRVNFTVEWMAHFSTTDKLDALAAPRHIGSSGLFKNTDGYGTLQVSISYSFSPVCTTCNKDD